MLVTALQLRTGLRRQLLQSRAGCAADEKFGVLREREASLLKGVRSDRLQAVDSQDTLHQRSLG